MENKKGTLLRKTVAKHRKGKLRKIMLRRYHIRPIHTQFKIVHTVLSRENCCRKFTFTFKKIAWPQIAAKKKETNTRYALLASQLEI